MFSPEELKLMREYEVPCPHCQKRTPLHLCGFVQTYFCERPHGCVGGAQWWPNEDIMQCLIICPHSCLSDGNNLATRIMDLPITRQEKDWVFGLIQQVTKLSELKLGYIFGNHYVQYGINKKIENSEERRKRMEEVFDY